MDAYLFEGAPKPVQILPEALGMGGSWEGNAGRPVPLAWESHLVKRVHDFLAPLDRPVLVDVGANTGSYALLPALLPSLRVAAFEPNPAACRILRQMLTQNGIFRNRAWTYEVALWSEESFGSVGQLQIPSPHASGCATLGHPTRFHPVGHTEVPLATLDNLIIKLKPSQFSTVDFLKIDTEGAEKFVLQGAKETIARYRPTMLIECVAMNTAAFDYAPDETLALLEQYGYSYEWVSTEDVWTTPQ